MNKGKRYFVLDSDILIAGRQTFRGMFGISSDVYVTLDRGDYENDIRPSVESEPLKKGEVFVLTALGSRFSLRGDIYLPEIYGLEGVKVTNLREYANERVKEALDDFVDRRIADVIRDRNPDALGNMDPQMNAILQRKLRDETIASVKKIVSDAVEKIDSIGVGKISIELRNNPAIPGASLNGQGNPSIHITTPGQRVIDVPLSGNEAELVKLALEGVLRMPDYERMEDPAQWTSLTDSPILYWPSNLLKDVWYQNLGQKTRYSGLKTARLFLRRIPEKLTRD